MTEQTQPMDWDLALSTLDMPADDRASIEAEKNAAYDPARPKAGEKQAQASSTEPVANEQTESSATASTVTAETAQAAPVEQQNDDYFEFDPTKSYKLPDGTTLKGSQVLQGFAKKAELDKERWQFNKEKESLQSRLGWLETAEKSDSTRQLLQLIDSGIPEEQAIAIVAEGRAKKAATTEQQAPSQSFAIDPAELAARLPQMPADMEAGSPEANNWYLNVYEPAKTAATIAITLEQQQKIIDQRAAQQQAEIEQRSKQTAEAQKVAEYNDSMVGKMSTYMMQWYGINYDALTPEQKADANTRLEQALIENNLGWVVDESAKSKNVLRETDVKAVVRDAFPENANPYKVGVPARPTTSQEKPLSAEPAAAQVKATSTHGFSPDNYSSPMDAALAELAMQK